MNRILTCSLSLAMALTTAAPLFAAPKDERQNRGRAQAAAAQAQRSPNRTVTTPAGRVNREIAAARESRADSGRQRAVIQQRAAQQRAQAQVQQRAAQQRQSAARVQATAQQRAAQQRAQAQVQQRSLEQRQNAARATAQQRALQQRAEAQQQLARQKAEAQQRSLEQKRDVAQNRAEAERRAAAARQQLATDDMRRRADLARRSNELEQNRAIAEARRDRRDDDRRDRDWSDDDRRRWGRWDNDDRRRGWERYRYYRAPSWVYRNWDRGRSYWWNDHRYHWYGGNWVIIDPGYAYVESYSTPTLIGSNLILEVQSELIAAGYDPGVADGVMGPMTRNAIAQYQADRGLPITGIIDNTLLASLGIS